MRGEPGGTAASITLPTQPLRADAALASRPSPCEPSLPSGTLAGPALPRLATCKQVARRYHIALPLRGARRGLRRRHQPSSHGSGAIQRGRRMTPALADGASRTGPLRARATGASPQPDPLEHLLSRDRGSSGWRLRRHREPIQHVRHAGRTPRRSHLTGSACAEPARPLFAPVCTGARLRGPPACASVDDEPACAGPPASREPRAASPVPPRRGAGSAAPEVPSVDGPPTYRGLDCPQAVDNLWTEPGASRIVARTHRP
jgi:hypothetical protein